MQLDCLVRNGTVVCPDLGPASIDIGIREGRIAALLEPGMGLPPAGLTIDASGRHVFPGIIDAHMHWGYADPPHEYTTETRCAALGGVTTLLGYFLKNEPYDALFRTLVREAEGRAYVDFALHFGAHQEAHITDLGKYVKEFGVTSYKYFMNYKGEEARHLGLAGTDDGFLYAFFQEAARFPEVIVAVHPENIEIIWRLRKEYQDAGREGLRAYCESRPALAEAENILRALYLAEQAGCRLYIVHLSCALGLEEVRRYRQRYDRILLETCPHYLTHTLDSDVGSLAKASPPLRTRADAEALWAAIADGTVDVVGSDHVPRKRATKELGIWKASSGFPGIGTLLPLMLSEGYHRRGLPLQRIAQVLSANPARVFGLGGRKGSLAIGSDADLTVVDLELEREVRAAELGSYSDYSLYEGWRLKGWPVLTMVRGTVVMRDGQVVGPAGHGRYLRRPAAPAA
jgi:dihydropyrimidinase